MEKQSTLSFSANLNFSLALNQCSIVFVFNWVSPLPHVRCFWNLLSNINLVLRFERKDVQIWYLLFDYANKETYESTMKFPFLSSLSYLSFTMHNLEIECKTKQHSKKKLKLDTNFYLMPCSTYCLAHFNWLYHPGSYGFCLSLRTLCLGKKF